LLDRQDRVFIEVGPGQTLSTFTRQHLKEDDNRAVLASMRHPNDKRPDTAFFLLALGKLWASGGRISWKKFYSGEKRHRIPLTTYPFERQRYWIDAVESGYTVKKQRLMRNVTLDKKQDVGEWFYKNTWKITAPVPPVKNKGGLQLVFTDSCNVGARLI
jgi:acyl transferase domain-containing protein